jgi:hypothetical protein
MTGQSPSGWRNTLSSTAMTLLTTAIGIYIAVKLISAVLPELIVTIVVASIIYTTFRIYRHFNGW